MASDGATALALLAIERDGNHALGFDLEIDLVADDNLSSRYREAGFPTDGDGC